MFLEQAFFNGNKFWKYLLGTFIIFIFTLIGQIPFMIAVFSKLEEKRDTIYGKDETALLQVLDSNFQLFLMLLSFVFAFLGFIFVVKTLHKQPLVKIITSRASIDWNRILFSFTVWAVLQVLILLVSYFISPADYQLNFELKPFLILFFIALFMIPIQTSIEELMFRGYLMQGFALVFKNKLIPLFFTSVLFGVLHISNPEVAKLGNILVLYYIGTGLFLGIITLMDEGMELSLGFHAANNLITALLVTSKWTVLQTASVLKDVSNPKLSFELFLPIVIIFPILLMIFSNKYHWKNWEEKLKGTILIQNK
ncbi:abortive phage infection protein [Flavobacterium covae]|uniref:CPBP family intramembrane glutamic endopeptidase n=1 Tax=Flavobacterium covae TaxID=2906076 RepID=A0ABW8PIV1_9FLAO|nr:MULTISPECIES: CPBP family intramembrane glutamic endopeptidase [Flavobacterium]AND65253.1 abortive phage infection protein [Flavobacterium covae]OWP81061.1 abortive phage infection protein [Flavobacterium covae]POR21714.1 abortive phage infection protein [Flavobacterium columnare]